MANTDSFFSRRRLGLAGIAALVGCAACCVGPLLLAIGLSSGAVAAFSSVFRPGTELLTGGVFFVGALGAMALYRRMKGTVGCSTSCKLDGSCCDRGAAPRRT